MTVVARHLREHGGVVVWLAAGEELCEQAAGEFERAWASLGHAPASITRFWGGHAPPLGDAPSGLVVAGLSKLYARARSHLADVAALGARTTLVVFDEAHQAVARTYRLVTETLLHVQFEPPGLLGLSATPGRTWNDPDADARLAAFFDRTKVTLEVEGWASPVDYLVDQGYLARPDWRSLPVDDGGGLSDADLARVRDGLDVPDDVLRRLAQDEQRSLRILVEAEALLSRHDRVLVFATTVWHAELLAVVLAARGHAAASVTGATPSAERADRVARFRAPGGPAQALCNFGVLTTGFDAPRTSAALIARPTKSLVLYSQMVGRAIRGPRAGGQSEAEIVTVVDTALPGFGSLADAFSNWEDVWT